MAPSTAVPLRPATRKKGWGALSLIARGRRRGLGAHPAGSWPTKCAAARVTPPAAPAASRMATTSRPMAPSLAQLGLLTAAMPHIKSSVIAAPVVRGSKRQAERASGA